MIRPSASNHPRVMNCPASAVLPQIRDTGPAAERGIGVHEYIPRAMVDRDAALAMCPDSIRTLCEQIDLGDVPMGEHEVQMSYDGWPGRADVIEQAKKGTIVWDYKTGKDVGPPAENKQLRTLAWLRARETGQELIGIGIIYIWTDGSLHRDGPYWLDTLELDVIENDLEKLSKELAWDTERLADGDPITVKTGAWCRYCPALTSCPAQLSLVRRIAGNGLEGGSRADLYRWLRALEDLVNKAKQAMALSAMDDPIDLGNGTCYGIKPGGGREYVTDPKLAYQALLKKFGSQAAIDSVSGVKMSKASIKASVGVAGIEAVRAAGAITAKANERPEEYRSGS